MERNTQFVGQSSAFLDSVERASRAAPMGRPVLVIGERGTGKELIAERLHQLSKRWAGVLVLICGGLLLLELLSRGRSRYARIGAGAARRATPVRLGLATPLALLALTALLALALGVPLVSLGRWLVISRSTAFPLGELASVTVRSLGLGLLGAVVTTVLALPVAWVSVRRGGWLSQLIERSTFGSVGVQVIVPMS